MNDESFLLSLKHRGTAGYNVRILWNLGSQKLINGLAQEPSLHFAPRALDPDMNSNDSI